VLLSLGKNSQANRHCYPALQQYYMARRALLGSRTPSNDALVMARENLNDAHYQAQICTCDGLAETLAGLVEGGSGDSPISGEAANRILAASKEVNAAVAERHR
jgi:hypothetical protein